MISMVALSDTSFQIPGAPSWLNLVLGVGVPIVIYFLSTYLKQKAAETRVSIELGEEDKREALEGRLKHFLLIRAQSIMEKEFPTLASRVIEDVSNGVSKVDLISNVRKDLHALGDSLLTEAKDYFSVNDIDIAKELGEEYIGKLIEFVANSVSPFPGKSTAACLVTGGASLLLEHGSAWLKENALNGSQ